MKLEQQIPAQMEAVRRVGPSAEHPGSQPISRDEQMKDLARHIPGGAFRCTKDAPFTLLSMSDGFLSMFGFTRGEIKTQFDDGFLNMIAPADRGEMQRSLDHQLSKQATIELEYRVLSKNDGPLWILGKSSLLDDGMGGQSFYCILIEISGRKKQQEELRLSLERHKIIVDQATDIIFEWNVVDDSLFFSANWRKKFGYHPISQNVTTEIPKSSKIHPDDISAYVKITKDIISGVPYAETELRIQTQSGQYLWSRIRATTQFDDEGHPIKAVGVIIDISTEKMERLALLEQAQRDALTGLYNKATMQILTEERMNNTEDDNIQAMFIIDVDNFKAVNDTYGHLCGDSLLSDIAAVLKCNFRSSDLIGRIGGDEFLVYMPEVSGESAATAKADMVLKALGEVRPTQDSAPISCSLGAAVFPHNAIDYFALYQCADRALYYIKNKGKNGYAVYDPVLCSDSLPCGLARSAVSAAIESEESTTVDEKLAQYTFRMLYRSYDLRTTINRLMEIVGRTYGSSRAYIFESSEDGLRCSNTFEWCAQGVPAQIEALQGLRYLEDLGDYQRNFRDNSVFQCRDICELHPDVCAVLKPQGISAILQCAVLDSGRFQGFVGFDECRKDRFWTREQVSSLTLIANVVASFLIKLRLEEKLRRLTGGSGAHK